MTRWGLGEALASADSRPASESSDLTESLSSANTPAPEALLVGSALSHSSSTVLLPASAAMLE